MSKVKGLLNDSGLESIANQSNEAIPAGAFEAHTDHVLLTTIKDKLYCLDSEITDFDFAQLIYAEFISPVLQDRQEERESHYADNLPF